MQTDLNTGLIDPVIRKASLTLRALNHRLRQLIILDITAAGNKRTVTDIYTRLNLEQSVASQHLAILRKAKVVTTTRDGKFIFYSVDHAQIDKIKATCLQLV